MVTYMTFSRYKTIERLKILTDCQDVVVNRIKDWGGIEAIWIGRIAKSIAIMEITYESMSA
jgi:hypothetical protein